jgi:ketosteroid isomerase-like protein
MAQLLSKQEWTNKQKEVWRNVETYTSLIINGDVKKFSDYFHKDFSSWNFYDLMPISKTNIKKELQHFPKREIEFYNITPVSIKVFDDVAIVHYFYSAEYKNTSGKERTKQGRNTDILLKQKDKWVLIGDNAQPFRKQIKFIG